jgi:hypothetical protein
VLVSIEELSRPTELVTSRLVNVCALIVSAPFRRRAKLLAMPIKTAGWLVASLCTAKRMLDRLLKSRQDESANRGSYHSHLRNLQS